MKVRSNQAEFKVNDVKFDVNELESDSKYVRKTHAKQKVNNILIECESFERYIKNDGDKQISELTLWVDIKVFGNHKYKPVYNYELHSGLNHKYNQIYDTTTDIYPIKIGSRHYETLQRLLGFISKGFDEYIANFVNLVVQMNNGKELTGVPKFMLNIGDIVTNLDANNSNTLNQNK